MNIQIYCLKKSFDVQKAERWFKERRIPYQLVDLKRAKLGPRELQNIAAKVGLRALVDDASDAYKKSVIPHLSGEQAIVEALLADPRLLKTPIVRNGREAAVGYQPDVWAAWESQQKK